MRKLKGDYGWYHQRLKDVPLGTCDLCGGVGRYKTTFKHKREVISKCWQCSATGFVKVKVEYTGEYQQALWPNSKYDLINETDNSYVIINRDKELMQVPKDNFVKTT